MTRHRDTEAEAQVQLRVFGHCVFGNRGDTHEECRTLARSGELAILCEAPRAYTAGDGWWDRRSVDLDCETIQHAAGPYRVPDCWALAGYAGWRWAQEQLDDVVSDEFVGMMRAAGFG